MATMNIDYVEEIDLARLDLLDNLSRHEKDAIRRRYRGKKAGPPRADAKPAAGADVNDRIAWQARRSRDSRNARFRRIAGRTSAAYVFAFVAVLLLLLYFVLHYRT